MLIDRKSQRHRPINLRSGFTLIELLIVIGVIVVLIALLLPSVASVRARARSAECQSNLAQLGLAMKAANRNRSTPVRSEREVLDTNGDPKLDADGNPITISWAYQIEPFLEGENEELFNCPADFEAENRTADQRDPTHPDFKGSFGANNQMHRMQGSDGNKVTLLDLGDGNDDGANESQFFVTPPGGTNNWGDDEENGQPFWDAAINDAGDRHAGNVNALRHDGSVSAESSDDLQENHPASGSGDWVPWRADGTPWEGSSDPVADIDTDGDGITSSEDNCPNSYNPGQEDANANGTGDVCEETDPDPPDDLGHDNDEDGISSNGDGSDSAGDNPCGPGQSENCDDNCPDGYNPDQTDHNGNGDYCDDFEEDNCYNAISGFPELHGYTVDTETHILPIDGGEVPGRVQLIEESDCSYKLWFEDAGDEDWDTELTVQRLGTGIISLQYTYRNSSIFTHTLKDPDGNTVIQIGPGGPGGGPIPPAQAYVNGQDGSENCGCAEVPGGDGEAAGPYGYNLGGAEYTASDGVIYYGGNGATPIGGQQGNFTTNVSGSADDPLWQQVYWVQSTNSSPEQQFTLSLPLATAADYRVTFYAASISGYKPVQNISLENGAATISGWSPWINSGWPFSEPFSQEATVHVSDGILDITVSATNGFGAWLSAIKIEQQ